MKYKNCEFHEVFVSLVNQFANHQSVIMGGCWNSFTYSGHSACDTYSTPYSRGWVIAVRNICNHTER